MSDQGSEPDSSMGDPNTSPVARSVITQRPSAAGLKDRIGSEAIAAAVTSEFLGPQIATVSPCGSQAPFVGIRYWFTWNARSVRSAIRRSAARESSDEMT